MAPYPPAWPAQRRRLLRRLAAALAARALPVVAGPVVAGPVPVAATAAAAAHPSGQAAPDHSPDRVAPGHRLQFPRDHGAHPGASLEWWYATGWLQPTGGDAGGANVKADGGAGVGVGVGVGVGANPGASGAASDRRVGGAWPPQPSHGFQITFFRSRTAVADLPVALSAGRFAPRQLLFAHAAVTDLAAGRHRHAQRISRWSGDETAPEAHARRADTTLVLGPWSMRREPLGDSSIYRSRISAPEAGLALDLHLSSTQPLLLQGQAGWSQKGPAPQQASHYYSQPQLAVRATLTQDGRAQTLVGQGWLDHEWSHALLASDAVGWDWTGINLFDGGALTAFVLRRADGSLLWAGGSHRPPSTVGQPPARVQSFTPQQVQFNALRRWTSPDTGAHYPVHWRVTTPVGQFELRALLDAQELDSRASTGAIYWEGLAELLDDRGQRVGLGYLEMTGRAGALKLSG